MDMPLFPWAARRQIIVMSVIIGLALLLSLTIFFFNRPVPSCFDNIQNQGEEGVDCGGPCVPCANKIQNLVIVWTRFFPTRGGFVDVAALLQNNNQFLQAKELVYGVRVYDKDNILIAIRENKTVVEPSDVILLLEPSIPVASRVPARAVVEIRSVRWEKKEPSVVRIEVLQTGLHLTDTPPSLTAHIQNKGSIPYAQIEASVILYNIQGDALGVSRTIIDRLDIGEERDLSFTWPASIEEVARAAVLFRLLP